ncbi:Bug family tripartite tricarboxylate transporter substrate binding protein [Massilia niastensis]|uniref:Bug family tripartite tricarboxylate transporter substrate binding protein n=1 Tax=Massilia niastensis TaxID=544911 RepID=UPI00146B08AB|nr:tripartite tricarboxylate transporter substrate binding protein [Massilia niastensis]
MKSRIGGIAVAAAIRSLMAAAAIALPPQAVYAQAPWPTQPIKIIVPFSPGGSNDNVARLLSSKLGARLGQPVVVENKGGAGGTIGTDFVAKARPDGYTLLFASTSITTNAAIGKKLPYDPAKDLSPIGVIATSPFAIVVSNKVKATTLREFIDLAHAKPRSINYGTAGIGGTNHMATEMFASAAKAQFVHVPYKGISVAFTDLMGGSLQMLVPSLASATSHIQAGSMRALAVTSAERSPLAPNIPTAAEAGLPDFHLEVWYGLLGPAKLSPEVIKRLNTELNAVLAMPDVKQVLAREAATPQPGAPAALGNLIQSELTRWTRLVKENNIRIE